MTREYALEIVKDGKVFAVEESNHDSQRITEHNWDTRHLRGPMRSCDMTADEINNLHKTKGPNR